MVGKKAADCNIYVDYYNSLGLLHETAKDGEDDPIIFHRWELY
jgi:hypothetical protein